MTRVKVRVARQSPPRVKAVQAQTKSPVYRDPPHTSGISSAEKTRDLTTQNP